MIKRRMETADLERSSDLFILISIYSYKTLLAHTNIIKTYIIILNFRENSTLVKKSIAYENNKLIAREPKIEQLLKNTGLMN
jgi:hypothetical protein